jgi:hypothetical protein
MVTSLQASQLGTAGPSGCAPEVGGAKDGGQDPSVAAALATALVVHDEENTKVTDEEATRAEDGDVHILSSAPGRRATPRRRSSRAYGSCSSSQEVQTQEELSAAAQAKEKAMTDDQAKKEAQEQREARKEATRVKRNLQKKANRLAKKEEKENARERSQVAQAIALSLNDQSRGEDLAQVCPSSDPDDDIDVEDTGDTMD